MNLLPRVVLAFIFLSIALSLLGCDDNTDDTTHDVSIALACKSSNTGGSCDSWTSTGTVVSRGVDDNKDTDIDFVYTCASTDELEVCDKWKITGEARSTEAESDVSCFPGDAKVVTRSGSKRIDNIRLGDEVLGLDVATGNVEFTQVRAWLHRKSDSTLQLTSIHTSAGRIAASHWHTIAFGSHRHEMAFARDFHVGDTLLTPTGSILVHNITQEKGHGLYAPLTWTSNLFVAAEDSQSFFLADCFGHVPTPWRFHALFHALLSATEWFWPAVHSINDSGKTDYLHPVCSWAISLFGVPSGSGATGERAELI